jgi:hypothetical protein
MFLIPLIKQFVIRLRRHIFLAYLHYVVVKRDPLFTRQFHKLGWLHEHPRRVTVKIPGLGFVYIARTRRMAVVFVVIVSIICLLTV